MPAYELVAVLVVKRKCYIMFPCYMLLRVTVWQYVNQGFLTFFVSFTPFRKKEVQFTPSLPLLLFRY